MALPYDADGVQRPLFSLRLKDSEQNDNMAVNGSVTPVSYKIQPPSNQIWRIAEWFIYIEDEKGFSVTNYGSNGVLTNGLSVNGRFGGVVSDLLGFNLKSNSDIMSVTYHNQLSTWGVAGTNDVFMAKWKFTDSGQFVRLDGSQGDYLEVIVNDDMTFLANQYITAKGYRE